MQVRTYIRGLSLVSITLCTALLPLTSSSHALASTALEIKGTVTAITSDSLNITATGGQAITFHLTATTVYTKYGQPAQQADVHVGFYVKVKYHQEADGTLKAKKVRIEHPPAITTATPTAKTSPPTAAPTATSSSLIGQPVAFSLDGVALSHTTSTLVVRVNTLLAGRTRLATRARHRLTLQVLRETTIVFGSHAARLGTLAVGTPVHVTGTLAQGHFIARRITAYSTARHR